MLNNIDLRDTAICKACKQTINPWRCACKPGSDNDDYSSESAGTENPESKVTSTTPAHLPRPELIMGGKHWAQFIPVLPALENAVTFPQIQDLIKVECDFVQGLIKFKASPNLNDEQQDKLDDFFDELKKEFVVFKDTVQLDEQTVSLFNNVLTLRVPMQKLEQLLEHLIKHDMLPASIIPNPAETFSQALRDSQVWQHQVTPDQMQPGLFRTEEASFETSPSPKPTSQSEEGSEETEDNQETTREAISPFSMTPSPPWMKGWL